MQVYNFVKTCFFFLKSLGILWPVDEAYSRLTTRQPERFWTSGQWMTERQGGSDVGQWLTCFFSNGHSVVCVLMQLLTSEWICFLPQPMAQRQSQLVKPTGRTNYTASSGSLLRQTQT